MKRVTQVVSIFTILMLAMALMPVGSAMAAAAPTVSTPVVAPLPIGPGAEEAVTATITADPADPTVTIVSASYTLNGGTAVPMAAVDGAFGGASEDVTGTFTAPQSGTIHLCVTGVDSVGGSTSVCVDLAIDNVPPKVTSIRVVTDSAGNATFTATVDDSATGGSNITSVKYTFDSLTKIDIPLSGTPSPTVTVSADLGTIGAGSHELCVIGTDAAGNVDTDKQYCIKFDTYTFKGFLPPIRMDVPNLVTAPRTIPIKWWLLKADGKPAAKATLFSSIQVMSYDCKDSIDDAKGIGSPGKKGLKNLGGGRWQINWKTGKEWRGTCRKMFVAIGDFTAGSKAFSSVQFSPEVQFDFRDNGNPKK